MVYIICEDSGTGFQFWKNFNRLILDGKAIVEHTGRSEDDTGGINKFADKILSMNLYEGDVVYIAIDLGDAGAYTAIRDIRKDSTLRGYKLYGPRYFSLEEVFISFERLIEWCQIEHTNELLNIYEIERIAIKNGRSTFNIREKRESIKRLESILKRKFSTKAQFYKALIEVMTNPNNDINKQDRPWFHVSKHSIRECWLESCPYKVQYCKKCSCALLQLHMSSLDKIIELEDKSVLGRGSCSILDLKKYI